MLERRELLASNVIWQPLDQIPAPVRAGAQSYIQPASYQAAGLDLGLLQIQLQNAPLENTPAAQNPLQISLPTPTGGFARFFVVESPIMESGFAAQFGEIKTYSGQGIDDPTATLRFDLSPYGFHAQVLSPTTGTYFIDPYYHLDNSTFISYFKRDLLPVTNGNVTNTDGSVQTVNNFHNRSCGCLLCTGQVPSDVVVRSTSERPSSPTSTDATGSGTITVNPTTTTSTTAQRRLAARSGTQLRTYRLAVAATGEYTQFHGGTVPLAQAAIVTAINRVTAIYESELTIRLTLVANNSSLVYTDPFTDPYTDSNPSALLSENQTNIDAVIGDANYDIGHVFSTGGGGLAGLGVVGQSGLKAEGETGSSTPIGDGFYVDYVAHEMGHQFGANHTFNGVDGALFGNENPGTAYEPGSGSTIMAYAGIALTDDLQANSDPYFHSVSFDEILAYVSSGPGLAAAQLTPTGNIVPTVNAGTDFSIPTNTPFVLTATGSDANGDTLTYSWEERDLGPQQALASPDNGSSPLFRVWSPTTSPSRTFPRLSDLVNNTTDPGEVMPIQARTMNFRVTARDNRTGGGGINTDDMIVDVINTGASFAVTSPNTAVTWTGLSSQTVTWNVAGTTAAPISTANVRILLSTDGGLTYPTVVMASTANDGSEVITVPNIGTTTARIRVEAVGNIYFDISDANFTINSVIGGSVNLSPPTAVAVSEGGTTATYTLVLNTVPTANVDITVTPDSQATIVPVAPLVFTPGNWNIPQTVTVTAVNDSIAEGAHTGLINHTAASVDPAYNGITINSITANITDNDAVGVTITESGGATNVTEGGATDTYTVVLTSQPTNDVTIGLSVSSQYTTAPTSLVFTSANWNTAQTVTVTATDDALLEGPHTASITHNAASSDLAYNGLVITRVTANITDNDSASGVTIAPTGGSTDVTEGGATDSYTVVLNSAPTANVIITVNAGTQLTGNPTTLTFTPANWSVAQTVMVVAVNDTVAEGLHSGTVTHTSSSADSSYNGIGIASLTANITDNDTPGITLVPASPSVAEGSAGVPVTVVLNTQPTANVVITFNPGTQLTLSSPVFTFTSANWNVAQLLTLTAVNDVLVEGAHSGTVAFTLTSTDSSYNGLSVPALTASIADNDIPGVTLSVSSLSVLEGATTSYSAVLNVPPTANVTINIGSGSFATPAPTSLTFTPLNWNVAQTVIVTGVDNVLVGNNADLLTHTVVSGDAAYNGLAVPSLAVTVIDNEGAPVLGTASADRIIVSNTTDLSTINVSVNGKITSFASSVGQIIIDSLGGNDTIQVNNPLVPITLLGGTGKDTVTVAGQSAANNFDVDTASLTVNSELVTLFDVEGLVVAGKAGDDIFNVVNQPLFGVELRGDSGNDVVNGSSRANTWVINNPNAGTLNSNVKFTAIENLNGGNSTDGFFFNSGKKITGVIDGGAGTNSLNYSASSSTVTVNLQAGLATGMASFTNLDEFVGSKSSSDRLVGYDQVSTWNINTLNSGTVGTTTFQNFENLVGGQLDDTFHFANGQGLRGKIDGGAGSNTLDYGSFTRSITVNLQYGQATNIGGFANLSQIIAGSATDTLIGANQINDWNLTGTNVGTLNTLAFSGFENLTGGIKNDTFNLGAAGLWTGLLNAATGTDVLNSFSGGVYNITSASTGSGVLNGRRFQGCEVRR